MRTTVLFTVASLFLIGSYSLPQPEDFEASRAIENREAKGGPGDPFPGHSTEEWKHRKQDGGDSTALNATKIKEREVHHGRPVEFPDDFHHKQGGDGSPTANATNIKERQEGPPAGHAIGPPDGMTWKEFLEHEKHKSGSKSKSANVPLSTGTSSTGTPSAGDTQDLSGVTTETGNSTKARMLKFKD